MRKIVGGPSFVVDLETQLPSKFSLSFSLTWHGVVVPDDLDVLAVARSPRVGDEDAVEGEVLIVCFD